jgi:hypothetical protein
MTTSEAVFCFKRQYENESNKYFEARKLGAPIEAASYFWNMHYQIQQNHTIDLASAFAEANSDEPVENLTRDWSADIDGDFLLFRYYIDMNGEITATKLADLEKNSKYKVFFRGHYAEFLSKYDDFLSKSILEYERFYNLSPSALKLARDPYMTISEIKTKIDQIQQRLLHRKSERDEMELITWLNEHQRISRL